MVVKETSDCLKALLSTQTGSDLLKENEEDLHILDPFRVKRKVRRRELICFTVQHVPVLYDGLLIMIIV